ncbi:MAG: hypothetical protein FWD43_01355 [Coriobacteriia bacterium]|nr:hypothetical protein [Coriobacteriia bacterium]
MARSQRARDAGILAESESANGPLRAEANSESSVVLDVRSRNRAEM